MKTIEHKTAKDTIFQNLIKLNPDMSKNLEKNTDNGHKNCNLNAFPKFEGSQVPTLFNDGQQLTGMLKRS